LAKLTKIEFREQKIRLTCPDPDLPFPDLPPHPKPKRKLNKNWLKEGIQFGDEEPPVVLTEEELEGKLGLWLTARCTTGAFHC
jgi:hypothetical protein